MTARRTDMHRIQELIRLHRMDQSVRSIARQLRMGRDTVRSYQTALRAAGVLDGDDPAEIPALEDLRVVIQEHLPSPPPPQQASRIADWQPAIAAMLERGAGPTAIYDRLRLEHPDFPGSLSSIKRLALRIRKEQGVSPEDVAIPVETGPGEVAQVDFGYLGRLYDPDRGVLRRAWVFVLTLGYSRHLWADIVFDQKSETWLELHVRAFQELGGVPGTVVPDNLKAAVIRAAFGVDGEPVLQRSYRELARHYGFRIEPTPPRSPEKKGKVESAVKYVKRSFWAPRELTDIRDARAQLQVWVAGIAGKRVHGTTRQQPLELFEQEERAALAPLPLRPFELVVWKQAKVHQDGHVQVDGALYSVPWPHLGADLWVRATPKSVTLYHEDERLATHARVGKGRRSTVEEHLPEYRRDLRHRSRSYLLGDPGREDRSRGAGLHRRDLRLRRRAVEAAHGAGRRGFSREVPEGARRGGKRPRSILRLLQPRRAQAHPAPGPRLAAHSGDEAARLDDGRALRPETHPDSLQPTGGPRWGSPMN